MTWPFITQLCLAFLSGILLNLTPCVLPVLPFKIRALLKEKEQKLTQRLLSALSFGLGSLVFFGILSFLTSGLGIMWGGLFRYKGFVVLLSLFLLASGLLMFVNFNFKLPQFLYNIGSNGLLGSFLTGFIAAILSTPCTGPFLGSVLVFALSQPSELILFLFLSIGTGLAFPYVLLILFPVLLQKLPKGGKWTVQVRKLLGWGVIAAAIFFSQSLFPDILNNILWMAYISAMVLWSGYLFFHSHLALEKVIFGIVIVTVLSFSSGYFLLFSSPVDSQWTAYSEKDLDHSLKSHSIVFLEFTADWCFNCKVIEKTVFRDAQFLSLVKDHHIGLVQVDMTDLEGDLEDVLKIYGGTGLPYFVILNPKNKVLKAYSGMFTTQALIEDVILLLEGNG